MDLSKKEIGKRLTTLRKLKGLSQEELAVRLKISRSSLAQIELGNRNLDVFELKQLAITLNFSLDDFMSDNFEINTIVGEKSIEKKDRCKMRISVPKFQTQKFKTILLYILERCSGKPNVGETVLYKLLYFSDFNYYEIYEEHLTGSTYRKLPYGPVPTHLDAIINKMVDDAEIKRIKTDYHGYTQTRYIPLIKSDLTQLKASEKEVIDKVILQMSDWSATAISEYSHKDIPWLASKEGEEISYELSFYREAPFSVRNYNNEEDFEK